MGGRCRSSVGVNVGPVNGNVQMVWGNWQKVEETCDYVPGFSKGPLQKSTFRIYRKKMDFESMYDTILPAVLPILCLGGWNSTILEMVGKLQSP